MYMFVYCIRGILALTKNTFCLTPGELTVVDVGDAVTLAEDLGDISGVALNASAGYLSLAVENCQVWVLKLGWSNHDGAKSSKNVTEKCSKNVTEKCSKTSPSKSSKQPAEICSNRLSITDVAHFATLEGHKSIVIGLHYIGEKVA
jgi:hypothetical protein